MFSTFTRFNEPFSEGQVEPETSFSNKTPTNANTNLGIKTKTHSFSTDDDTTTPNRKVFKESKSFDVSSLNMVDLDESNHMYSRPQRLFQDVQDLSDPLSRSPSAYSKGRLFIEKNRPFVPEKTSEQLQQTNVETW